MNILFVAGIISNNAFEVLLKKGYNLRSTAQKFHGLILDGFLINGNLITNLSSIPIQKERKAILNNSKDKENLKFKYTSSFNMRILNDVIVFVSAFCISCKWCMKYKKKDSFIFVDNLSVSLSIAALLASKIFGIIIVSIITDLPVYMIKKNSSIRVHLAMKFAKSCICSFDCYVLLTEQMNRVVNPHNRPYIIMEGLVDVDMKCKNKNTSKNEKIALYAGGLYKKYGIVYMVDAFMRLGGDELRLYLFGDGDAVEYIKKCIQVDNRIKYFGECTNDVVIEEELKSTILINPRPTKEEFTKYSFPSKNMEYMVSATPLLTTVLPGMPKEYYDYVYFIEEESEEGIYNMLYKLFIKTQEKDLIEKGQKAKEFVMKNKNNIIQSKRIIDMIVKILNNNGF